MLGLIVAASLLGIVLAELLVWTGRLPTGAAVAAWAGGLVAELTRPRPDPGKLHAAALTPRTLGGYLSAGMLAAERLVAVAVVALVPLALRSEEHTSELQSRVDLVCR